MNTDYQDIKSYKKPNICENLCPNLTCFAPITAMGAYQSGNIALRAGSDRDFKRIFKMETVGG